MRLTFPPLMALIRGSSSMAGSLYPAYASFKAINTGDNNRLTAWLMYWSVMGLFSIAEFVLDTFIFWLPFYYEIKLLFVLWMILPQTQGSIFLYQAFVEPYLNQHEHEIDQTLKNIQKQAKAMGMQYVKQGIQLLQNLILDIYRKSLGQSDMSAQSVMDAHDQQPTHESTSSQARNMGAGQQHQELQGQQSQGYFSWAYNAVSPKLSAVATMASQHITRQTPSRPLPQPPVNLYAARTAPSSSTSRDGSISTTLGDNAFGITSSGSDPRSATLSSTTEKVIFDQLSSRLNKAAQSTGVGMSGSMRHRKISLYDDYESDDSPVPETSAPSSSSAGGHTKDRSWRSYASGFGQRSSAVQE
ncbi:receptor accessory protein 4 [Podila epicladia]|nr:receptor accessory protein 4 [Podila epicladia]